MAPLADAAMPDLPVLLLLLVLGSVSGFLAGLLGIGGGMILVPFLSQVLAHAGTAPDMQLKMAVATALATICLTSMSAVRAQQARGAIEWTVVRRLLPGVMLGTALGALLARHLPALGLTLMFGLFVGHAALKMLFVAGPAPQAGPGRPGLPGGLGLLGAGGLIGLLSALVGAGGAFLSVPMMGRWQVPMHRAVATSSALGLPLALAATMAYIVVCQGLPGRPEGSLGLVHLPSWLLLASTSVLAAPLGTRISHATQSRRLRRLFGLMLLGVAVEMLRRAWHLH